MTVDWTQLRTEYESGSASLRELARAYQVSKTTIIERRNKEKWNRPDAIRPVTAPPVKQIVPNRDVNAAVRAAEAAKLRAQKLTFDEIARRTGYGGASACRKAILREMQRVVVESVDELRREESAMLDVLQSEVWELAMDKKNTYRLYAVDRLLQISERRAKLMGLDVAKDGNLAANITVIREVPNGYLQEPKL